VAFVSEKSSLASFFYHLGLSSQLFVTLGYWIIVRDPVFDGHWTKQLYRHGTFVLVIGFLWTKSALPFNMQLARRIAMVWPSLVYAWLILYYWRGGISGKQNNYGAGIIYYNIRFAKWYEYVIVMPVSLVGISAILPYLVAACYQANNNIYSLIKRFSRNVRNPEQQ